MFLRRMTTTFTGNYSEQIQKLKNEAETADAVVIGVGAGMSTSAGMSYSGERFEKYLFLELGVGTNTPVFCSSSTRGKLRKNMNKQQISTSSNLIRKYEERRCA